MRQPIVPALAISFSLIAFGVSGVTLLRGGEDRAAPATAPVEEHDEEIELGEVMSSLGRRLASVWYAHQGDNPRLVEYELHEMEEVIEDLPRGVLFENGLDVVDMLNAVKNNRFPELRSARDPQQFDKAFQATLQQCNACHTATDHAFIRVGVPTASPVPYRVWDSDR